MSDFLDTLYYGNTGWEWGGALLWIVLFIILIGILDSFLRGWFVTLTLHLALILVKFIRVVLHWINAAVSRVANVGKLILPHIVTQWIGTVVAYGRNLGRLILPHDVRHQIRLIALPSVIARGLLLIERISKPLAVFVATSGVQWSLRGLILPDIVMYWVNSIFLAVVIALIIWLVIRLYETKLLAILVAVLGIQWSLSVLTVPDVVMLWANSIALVTLVLLTVWLIIWLYEAIRGELIISTKYVIISKLILSLLVVVAVLYFAWHWIIRPIDCTPDCIGANLVSRDLHRAHLPRVNFVEADFRGSDLSEANLHRADLSGANLTQTNLQRANLSGAKLIGANLSGADLRNAILDGADLSGANLTRANLTQVNLTRVRLNGATFDAAKLIEVDLSETNLRGGIFTLADLTGSNLTGADLSGSKFSQADLSGTVMRQTDLSGAWLNLANLTGADLTEASLAGASLIGSNLASVNLTEGILVSAVLIGAHLNGANLRAADLTDARLLRTELKPRDLLEDPVLKELNEPQRGPILKDADLSGVSFSSQTKWPQDKGEFLSDSIGLKSVEDTDVLPAADALTDLIDSGGIYLGARPIGVQDPEDIEYPDDEPPSEAEIHLGKVLYFDARLSGDNRISCATCHNPDLGLGDGVALGRGAMGSRLKRNTPHLYNLAWNVVFSWDGRAASLEEQALEPIQSTVEMNQPLDQLISKLKTVPYYVKAFNEVYPDSGITAENLAKAIAAFERTIVSDNSPFDRYMQGNKFAMSPAAKRGMQLFLGKADCILCHDGPNFTDNSFHNIGVQGDDPGRAKVTSDSMMVGAFKVPGLRNVSLTAPYMHDGSEATLEDVIRFYNAGGKNKEDISPIIRPLNLTKSEIADLVAFLEALTDPVVITTPEIP
jgi:cytochrome c peroxidase